MNINLRNITSWFIARALILFGFVRRAMFRAKRGDYILSIYFHNPTRKEFESCVKWLQKHEFTFITPQDLQRIERGEVAFPKGAALLTVDDGWQSNEGSIVAVANEYRIPVTIFVSTEPVEEGVYWWSYVYEAQRLKLGVKTVFEMKKVANDERIEVINRIKRTVTLPREALTVEQVKEISASDCITIGGHTHTHPILINCDQEQVYTELEVSKQKLNSWVGQEVKYFAYPNGDYGKREIKILKKLGYELAFNCKAYPISPEAIKDNFQLPRVGVLEGASFAENVCRMVGVWPLFMLKVRSFVKAKGRS